MRLKAFRVLNYRCIDDSGWINVDDIAAIVGKNESGKTSLLKALWKFNPYKKQPYSLDREWPRGLRKEKSENATVVEAIFSFDGEEKERLAAIDESCKQIVTVRFIHPWRVV